ncbi:hypothetical protein JAAARDRAFT_47393 [Jaapia argillacea MUCL 33604]|uniref:Uncharacterized protein n=1 Tax=Jaapia argillacea MUCL 33604 TaxID=933084 RepID=A0A067PRI0_9AGAM|nr:hypothetical protein JAAARDRAFT_47393 [Jaapia argillacea MUCL 33604]
MPIVGKVSNKKGKEKEINEPVSSQESHGMLMCGKNQNTVPTASSSPKCVATSTSQQTVVTFTRIGTRSSKPTNPPSETGEGNVTGQVRHEVDIFDPASPDNDDDQMVETKRFSTSNKPVKTSASSPMSIISISLSSASSEELTCKNRDVPLIKKSIRRVDSREMIVDESGSNIGNPPGYGALSSSSSTRQNLDPPFSMHKRKRAVSMETVEDEDVPMTPVKKATTSRKPSFIDDSSDVKIKDKDEVVPSHKPTGSQ